MTPPPRAARPSPPPRVAQPPRVAAPRVSRPAPAPRAAERVRPAPRQAAQPQRIERQQQRALQRQERVQQRQERAREARPQQQERVQRVRENRQELQALRNRQRQDLRAKGLTAPERQKLRAEQRQQLQDLRVKQRERVQADRPRRDADRQDRPRVERPDRSGRRAAGPRAAEREANRPQRDAQRAQRIQQRQQLREQRASNRADRSERRVSRDEARAGRFAARFADRRDRRQARAERAIARHAWRHGRRAAFVAWLGPIFYPYLYSDFFDYTFFPYAYDDGYWAYAYDDFIDGVFFAYGSPYADDPGAAPLAQIVPPVTTGATSPQGPALRPQTRRTVEQVCNPTQALTAWPFRQIEAAVRPTAEQQKLFEELKAAAGEAAGTFKSSCQTDFAMTPTGRLDAMTSRLEASLDALAVLRPALEAFYNALTDEQRARFDAIGPDLGRAEAKAARNRQADADACGGDKAGLSAVPIETLRDWLKPNDQQQALLDKLDDATNAAIDALATACPDAIPLTPTGRLEAMEKRLTAMVDAAETIRPALDAFYASLTSEQKAQFNTLGRQAQRGN
jgi:hypothetical protein